ARGLSELGGRPSRGDVAVACTSVRGVGATTVCGAAVVIHLKRAAAQQTAVASCSVHRRTQSHGVLSCAAVIVPSPALSPAEQRAVVSRVTRRLVAFAFICYVVAYVDRVNIGFAATPLQRDLRLSDTAYGIGAGLFFPGYCLFEIPSNVLLERVGARRWIARIMIVWGLVSMATMFVTSLASFYAARIVLGIAEAGFFPGMVLYLTYWIPAAERARTGALFMMAAPIAIIVGSPVSEMILSLDRRAGLAGWQWLFVLEGAPAVVLGILALWILTDRPEQARWLAPREREWLGATMAAERAARAQHGHEGVFAGF